MKVAFIHQLQVNRKRGKQAYALGVLGKAFHLLTFFLFSLESSFLALSCNGVSHDTGLSLSFFLFLTELFCKLALLLFAFGGNIGTTLGNTFPHGLFSLSNLLF